MPYCPDLSWVLPPGPPSGGGSSCALHAAFQAPRTGRGAEAGTGVRTHQETNEKDTTQQGLEVVFELWGAPGNPLLPQWSSSHPPHSRPDTISVL